MQLWPHCLTVLRTNVISYLEREAEILKPLASVEVTEKEDASFETEISEDDVAGEWKLKGEVLTRSPVSSTFTCFCHCFIMF